ncbi:MAG: LamG domain-containing protein [Kiritimatiellae bacterium]|jgi:hypothetical protein|nr:LamG domain-containing protein [Kiritimatiellia bacterium]
MKKYTTLPALFLTFVVPTWICAAVIGPYTSDGNTIALYHFDETAGVADPGTPLDNAVGTAAFDLTNTGGPDGRNNTGGGGYGAPAYTGFGSSFDVLGAGDGTYHTGSSTVATPTGGGATTGGAVLQSGLQGASGAFTLEALVNYNALGGEQTILAHDGDTRGFLFRFDTGGNLSFYNGSGSLTTTLPGSGDHSLQTGNWYHVAVTYTGAEAVTDNLAFYWTALDSAATEANLIGTATMSTDLNSGSDNPFGIGTTTKSSFRLETKGLIDEVRISNIARQADDFVFGVIPEPSTLLLMSLALLGLIAFRRRS